LLSRTISHKDRDPECRLVEPFRHALLPLHTQLIVLPRCLVCHSSQELCLSIGTSSEVLDNTVAYGRSGCNCQWMQMRVDIAPSRHERGLTSTARAFPSLFRWNQDRSNTGELTTAIVHLMAKMRVGPLYPCFHCAEHFHSQHDEWLFSAKTDGGYSFCLLTRRSCTTKIGRQTCGVQTALNTDIQEEYKLIAVSSSVSSPDIQL
jgi:hypothetical protein